MCMIRGGRPFCILTLALLTGVTSFAEATYTYEEDGKAYVVTVPTNETVTIEDSERWKFVVGEDGKSLYLDYIPRGSTIIIR